MVLQPFPLKGMMIRINKLFRDEDIVHSPGKPPKPVEV